MKKYLMVLAVLLMTSVAYAKESGYSLSTVLVGMSMDYREYGVTDSDGYGIYDAPESMEKILDSEKSSLEEITGVEFRLTYTKVLESDNYAQLGVNMMLLSGETEYVGSYIGSSEGYGSVGSSEGYDNVVEPTKNIVFDTDVDYRFTHVHKSGMEFSYGLGLGYRSWRRQLNASQVEIYHWYSLRPKIGLAYGLGGFYLGTLVEYQHGLNPKMSIDNPDVEVNLGGADIMRMSIPLKYEVTAELDMFVEYIVERQIIGKSDKAYFANGYLWEPRSEANNQYAKFGVAFKF